jgi:hypothetical protein
MDIKRIGSQPSTKGSTEYFTGIFNSTLTISLHEMTTMDVL